MPKKAVAIFFVLAFIGAAIFVFLTFPRTKDEIPTSNNQRPFPSAPVPSPPTPNSVPVPENVPQPATPTPPPKVPPGPTLRVMAWASAHDAQRLQNNVDAFAKATGRGVALTVQSDPAIYASDLREEINSSSPPDVCLVAARNFSGLDPARDFADVEPGPDIASRSIAAFTADNRIKALPDEFSVDVLYYNPTFFDQAGIGYPDRHWNWDILEADARALQSLKLKDDAGRAIYPLELPADFDFWNILCTQAGHPALDLGTWHLADDNTKESQMRALDFIHDIFQGLSITAPLPKKGQPSGTLFAQQRAAVFIGASDLTATMPNFGYRFTLLPSDMQRASMARVNGWAVTARAPDKDASRALANYLASQPIHAGWISAHQPVNDTTPNAICYEALGQALVPRIGPKSAHMAEFLDQEIGLLARDSSQKTDALYARIQDEFQDNMESPAISSRLPIPSNQKPVPKLDGPQVRGL